MDVNDEWKDVPDEVKRDYEVLRELGSGTYGVALLCKHRNSGSLVVAKVTRGAPPKRGVQHEHDVVATLPECPYLLRPTGLIPCRGHQPVILLPYMRGGDLLTLLNDRRAALPEAEARIIFLQLVAGLKHMHDHKIAHRDVKPENILFREPYNPRGKLEVVWTDFGFTREWDEDGTMQTVRGGTKI